MILVVDDEPMIVELIRTILRQGGFSVLTAKNGADALTISRLYRDKIDLLITDIVMPGMDGLTLSRKLTAENPKLPVLFVSGHCESWQFERQERVSFLPKPFSPHTLLEEVKTLTEAAHHLQAVG